MPIKKMRYYIFLKDVALLAVTAFGGPQVHIAMFLDLFVKKRGYLTEKEFLELNALCQVLPGPTSTQTIVALGFKVGGPNLAYLTLLIWCLPGVTMLTLFGLSISYLDQQSFSLNFLKLIQPMAVGFVWYAAFRISQLVVSTRIGFLLMFLSALAAYVFRSPWVFPLVVVGGGLVTSFQFHKQPKEADKQIRIRWGNFILFVGVLVGAAVLGAITRSLPIRLFENFYRNGSFIFGGGQVLIPVLFTEFVKFKGYLTADEFLTGYGLAQFAPGPVFSFVAYVGVLSMREYGLGGQLLGAFVSSMGIFLPGTFLIFFVIRFWEQLKKYRVVKASLEGVHASSSGLVVAAAILLLMPLYEEASSPTLAIINMGLVLLTFVILMFTKIPQPLLILIGLLGGFLIQALLPEWVVF
ncbi:MAG: chromate transporter [Microscillaceae bacterium]